MIFRSSVIVPENALEYLDESDNADADPGLFDEFALHALQQGLADFESSAGNRPFALKRGMAAFDQKRAPVRDHDSTDSHDGPFRIFARIAQVRHLRAQPAYTSERAIRSRTARVFAKFLYG